MNPIIAIVEDDPEQRMHYAQKLREYGYRVDEYDDRISAIAAFEKNLPDLAVLDIMLGTEVGGGYEISQYLSRQDANVPILFLSSRGDELDKIYGLQVGAWDYQTKPVSLDFLLARVASLLRIKAHKTNTHTQDDVHTIGRLQISPVSLQVCWDGTAVELTPTEFEILSALVKSRDVVTYDTLVNATKQGLVEENTINTHILHLRKKFKKVDPEFDCIKTRYGLGYHWTDQ